MFDQAALSRAVQAIVPEGHTSAIMGTVDNNGAQVIVGMNLGKNDEWEIQGQFQHTWTGDNNGQVKVLWSI